MTSSTLFAYIDHVKAVATKNKFVKYSLTAVPGKPHKVKHGPVQRPKFVDVYLKSAASTDKHNHVHTGSLGLENAWQRKHYNCRNYRIYLHKFLLRFILILHKENVHKASPFEKELS